MPSRCPNSRLIVANIVSRSASLLTSARMARLPAPSVPLAACSVLSFKPQMATRAPSRSNSCAVASPIPLLPPVIRIFLSVSLPIVVTPLDKNMPVSVTISGKSLADATYQIRETRFPESLLNRVVRCVEDWPKPSFHRAGHHASLMHLGREDLQTGQRNVAMFADHMEVMVHDNTQPMVHALHASVSLRSDGNFSAIGEVRLWRNDDNVAVLQPLLYLNASFCLLAAD